MCKKKFKHIDEDNIFEQKKQIKEFIYFKNINQITKKENGLEILYNKENFCISFYLNDLNKVTGLIEKIAKNAFDFLGITIRKDD